MIDTQVIRCKILDLAMRGRLTEQLPEDGTAEELYRQIQKEKQALIKAGKIKKEKPLPDISDEEIPFEIPKNWKWVGLSSISKKITDGTHNSPINTSEGEFMYVTAKNIKNGGVVLDDMTYVTKSVHEEIYSRCNPEKGDVLLIKDGATTGIVTVNNVEEPFSMLSSVALIKPLSFIDPWYVVYAMRSSWFYRFIRNEMTGVGITRVVLRQIQTFTMPLPPLAEQHRIVARIEQAFSALDTIDALQAKYADNLAVLKSKLIDAAIQGKLTEQLPEDGTAEELYRQIQAGKQALIKSGKIKKEKPLPEITAEEIPFEIPANWKWVRLASICYRIEAGGDKPQDFVKIKDREHIIPVVANGVSNDGIIGYTATSTAPANTITVAGRGTIGFPCYRNYDYCPVVRLIVIMQSALISPLYLYYVFRGLPADSVGSSIPQLTVPMVSPKVIPLPPLAEQRRIVSKLEELLPLCEMVKKYRS